MNDNKNVRSNLAGTAAVILSAFLLFYLPSMLAILGRGDEPWDWTILSIIMATMYTAIFCLNYFWIVPATLVRSDRKTLFFLGNALLIVFACSLVPVWFETHRGLPVPHHMRTLHLTLWQYLVGYAMFMLRDGIMMVLAVALAYALRLSREHENMRRRQLELDAEQRSLELRSLRAQLNPHFLFNSLNNIYALISISPDRAQTALHDLSGMLRYMIYDASAQFVPLEKELTFISDYVRLMKLRLSPSVALKCEIDRDGAEGMKVVPLLFLTIVENAFKHLAQTGADRFISISISAGEGRAECRVENSCSPEEEERRRSNSGVGLANIERQLRLLYPGAHTFTTEVNGNVFIAKISIEAR